MFWCTNCPTGPCLNASTNPTSLSTSDITKRINHTVRMPASLYTMNKKTLTVNASFSFDLPTFNGPSDQLVRSVNPLTNSVGVDKKHNSYDRYLARKRGKMICCCVCIQEIKNGTTGNVVFALLQVGDTVIQGSATGTIVWVGSGLGTAGDEDRFTANVHDCLNHPFLSSSEGGGNISFFRGGILLGTATLGDITVTTLKTCP